MLEIEIPGRAPLRARYLVLDVNGTLTCDGALIPGVAERIARLKSELQVILLTADTFGTADSIADALQVEVRILGPAQGGDRKAAIVRALDPSTTIAIGNGANDAAMLEAAALGIAVVEAEGAATTALLHADVVYRSIGEALDALCRPARLVATLRS